LADAPRENFDVTPVNEEIEMKAEMDRSIEPIEIEVKDDFEMSTAHGEENLINTSLNERIGNMEEIEMPLEDAHSLC